MAYDADARAWQEESNKLRTRLQRAEELLGVATARLDDAQTACGVTGLSSDPEANAARKRVADWENEVRSFLGGHHDD